VFGNQKLNIGYNVNPKHHIHFSANGVYKLEKVKGGCAIVHSLQTLLGLWGHAKELRYGPELQKGKDHPTSYKCFYPSWSSYWLHKDQILARTGHLITKPMKR
jgi:hypothetical protein